MVLKRLSQLTVLIFCLVSSFSLAEAVIAPSGLTAAPYSSGQILLNWVGDSQGSPIYSIERSVSATGGFAPVGSSGWWSTNYLDIGLTTGATYYYRVRAFYGSTASAYSNVASATAPGAVTTTTFTTSTTTITLRASTTTSTTLKATTTTSTTTTTLAQLAGPVANAGPDQFTQTLTAIAVNGSGSFDPGGTIASYAWTFGDGGTGSGMSITHAYSTPGTYTVTLTVTDNRGMKASDTAIVSVANRPPVANAGPDQTQTVGSPVTFSGSASDPDGRVTSYAWSFGDGTSGTGATPAHSYGAAGMYTATLTVTDDGGARGTDTALVTVTGSAVTPATWGRRFGGAGNEFGYGVAVDGGGNVVMTGHLEGATTDFGGGLTCPGWTIPVVKFSATGTPAWNRCLGGVVGGGEGTAVAVDGSGNVVVTGKFHGTVDFGGGPVTSMGPTDVFVAKYSPSGAYLWSRRMGSSAISLEETGNGVTVDSIGNVIVTGLVMGAADFGGGLQGDRGFFAAKYSPAGDYLWSKTASGRGRGVAVDAGGNVVATGDFMGTTDFGAGPLTSLIGSAIFVTKYSATGTPLWSKSLGGWTDAGNAVATDTAGNVVVTGHFGHWINFGTGWIPTRSGDDVFLVKYTPSGTLVWGKTFGGFGDDSGNGVAVDGGGNVVVTGRAGEDIDFGGGGLLANNNDAFVAKFSSVGAPLSSRLYGGNSWDQGNAVAIDGNGSVVVTGLALSTTIDLGGGPLAFAGGSDIFLLHGAP